MIRICVKRLLATSVILAIAGLAGRHLLRTQRRQTVLIRCRNCEQTLPDIAVFCAHCGQNLKESRSHQ